MPPRLPPRNCVTVSLASARIRATLSRCVIARAMRRSEKRDHLEVYVAQDAYGLQRADIERILLVALALRSHAGESENA